MTPPALESIRFDGPHGAVNAHIARPGGSGPFPAILLLHEGIGVVASLLTLAQRFAQAGYFVLAPDLFSREPGRKELSDTDVLISLPIVRKDNSEAALAALPAAQQAGAKRALAWWNSRNPASYFPDTQAALQLLERHPSVRADAIASLGFSQGGGLSAQLAAAGAALAAGVIYYGQGPASDRLAAVRYPLLGHYAEDDPSITPGLPALKSAFEAAGKQFSAHVYPGTKHGFFNELRPVYHRASAELAHARTLEFLEQHLGRRRQQQPAVGSARAANV